MKKTDVVSGVGISSLLFVNLSFSFWNTKNNKKNICIVVNPAKSSYLILLSHILFARYFF